MCCAALSLVFLGPRFFNVMWWLYNPSRWDRAFSNALWPILGIIFAPWTTLMYVTVQPGGVDGFEVFWIVLGVVTDVASYASGGYTNRDRINAYATR